ncbi:MAG: aminotransferase class IV [Myxococcota bacterium]
MRVSIDGAIVAADQALVPVTDRGFLYGDSVFETFRTYGRRAHALGRHLARLERSAASVALRLPVDAETFRAEVRALIDASEGERKIRLMVTRGDAAGLADDGARRVILSYPFQPHPEAHYSQGVVVTLVEGGRDLASAKAGSYLTSVLATRTARSRGAYEAILSQEDTILEGATSNVFFVREGCLYTSRAGVLPGVTRGLVLELARERGIPCAEGVVPRSLVAEAEEAFLTSATREVMPISRVDERVFGPPGPITKALLEAYRGSLGARVDGAERAR